MSEPPSLLMYIRQHRDIQNQPMFSFEEIRDMVTEHGLQAELKNMLLRKDVVDRVEIASTNGDIDQQLSALLAFCNALEVAIEEKLATS